MTIKLKVRLYAMFQFISFIAIIATLAASILIGYTVIFDGSNTDRALFNGTIWIKYISEVLVFEHLQAIGIFASMTTYIAMMLFLISWASGFLVFKVKNRNLLDSLFLFFVVLPFLSNIFALFAQIAVKQIDFTSSKINKKQVAIEQTRILELNQFDEEY